MTTTSEERPSRALLERPSTFNDPDNYPAIAIPQPHAGLIHLAGLGYCGKDIELRASSTSYRGKLAICSGNRIDRESYNRAKIQLVASGLVPAIEFEKACGSDNAGKLLALFEIRQCRRMKPDDYKLAFLSGEIADVTDQYAWIADRIDAIEPYLVTGRTGYFRIPRVAADAAIKHSTTGLQRIEIRSKAKRRQVVAQCDCGSSFPKHIAEFMNDKPEIVHVCRCGKEYVVKRNRFVVKNAESVEVSHDA